VNFTTEGAEVTEKTKIENSPHPALSPRGRGNFDFAPPSPNGAWKFIPFDGLPVYPVILSKIIKFPPGVARLAEVLRLTLRLKSS
jgi:hypothetical protein